MAVACGTYYLIYTEILSPNAPEDKRIIAVEISRNSTFSDIAKQLEKLGIIKTSFSLKVLARLKKQDAKIQAGEYELSPSMAPEEILKILWSGKMKIREVRIPEGFTIADISNVVAGAGLISSAEFTNAATDPILLAKAGIAASSFEGYLFPETYHFSRPINGQQLIWALNQEADKRWTQQMQRLADELRLSRHEILTLASIVEKESGNKDEQNLIASVFFNRLKLGMKLQSDPTVIYGIKDFNGNLTKNNLKEPHAYNTYVNFGLPPGPICNPGISSIMAVLSPAQSEYLYFVGDNNGKHIFSKTLEEHNIAVNKYQRKKLPLVVEEQLDLAAESKAE